MPHARGSVVVSVVALEAMADAEGAAVVEGLV